jgi:hypothetical protein
MGNRTGITHEFGCGWVEVGAIRSYRRDYPQYALREENGVSAFGREILETAMRDVHGLRYYDADRRLHSGNVASIHFLVPCAAE